MRRQEALAWVHPSVHDTVIEYLTEHDSLRQRFLRSATLGGVLLALRTRERGAASMPWRLLRTPADWAALEEAVRSVAAAGDLSDHQLLLRGVNEALDGCSDDARVRADVTSVAHTLLDGLAQNWRGEPAGLTASLLEAFYGLSIRTRHLVAEPDVSLAWRQASASLGSALREPVTETALGVVWQWVRLVRVLQRNQPRFLMIQRTAVDECTGRIVSWLQQADGLAPGDPDGPARAGHLDRARLLPRPGREAAGRRRRIDAAARVLEEVAGLSSGAGPDPDMAGEAVRQRLIHLRERGKRHLRERGPHAAAPGGQGPARHPGAHPASFDIGEFFGDL
jgi:hypothetical protein